MGDLNLPSPETSPQRKRGLPDHFGIGTVLGVVCFGLGFLTFSAFWTWKNNTPYDYFVREVFLGTDIFQTKIITVSLVPVVIAFFLCQRAEKYRLCGGLMMVMVIGAIVAAVLW